MIEKSKRQTLREYCIENDRLELLCQWHPVKNGDHTPSNVPVGSNRKFWWMDELGHEWEQGLYNRCARRSGCPICAGRVILPGFNDLASKNPELAVQWHPNKNGSLTPQEVRPGSSRKVWWICSKGHEWRASPTTRVKMGAECPICSNYFALTGYNDLATTHPGIASQWHPTKNGSLTPQEIVAGSNRSVWWQCSLGHEWCAKVVDRTRGTNGCPYCANQKVLKEFNDLATTHPRIAEQWHPTLNGKLAPQMVTAGSTRKVWWLCPEGHVWRTAVYNRAGRNKQTGCPVCAGNARVKYRQRYYKDCFAKKSERTTSQEAI